MYFTISNTYIAKILKKKKNNKNQQKTIAYKRNDIADRKNKIVNNKKIIRKE